MNEMVQTTDNRNPSVVNLGGKYLTFTLDNEEYCITILKIKEIIGMMPITSVPQVPDFVKGVINLRGRVIPVMDFRLKFDMPQADYSDRTCIIVVEVEGESERINMGCIVDSVCEVLNISAGDISNTPDFGTSMNTEYILGMAKMEGNVKILLDIDLILNRKEISSLSQTKQ